jgi:DNA-binding transcriptional LysR family regulator
MNSSNEIFLLAAEEMSISKAAKRAFVTQQCASDHIRRLEELYGLELFNRRPKLTLTAAGQVVLQSLRHIKTLEKALVQNLNEIRGETTGHLRVGINPTRARIIVPPLMTKFMGEYPKVKVSFMLHDTISLARLLLKNEVDLFLGINTSSSEAFERNELARDNLFFLASTKLIQQYAPHFKLDAAKMLQSPIRLKDSAIFPLVRNLEASTLNEHIDYHANRDDVVLRAVSFISDYDTQVAMSGNSLAASFCPTMILHRVIEHNRLSGSADRLFIFPLQDLPEYLRLDLVRHRDTPQSQFATRFQDLFRAEVLDIYNQLSLYF